MVYLFFPNYQCNLCYILQNLFVFFRICRFVCAKYVSKYVCSWFEAGVGCRLDRHGSYDSGNIPNCNQVADCRYLFFFFFFFFFLIFTLYSPRHLTYRGSGRAIPLHALQTTVKVFLLDFISSSPLSCTFHAIWKAVLKQIKQPRRHHSVVGFYLSKGFLKLDQFICW